MTFDPGFDISSWQSTTPDLAAVDFVVVRAGYGSSTVDTRYAMHAANTRKAGKFLGAYWFWYDGQDNATAVQTFLATAGAVDFYVLDLEGANAATVGPAQAKDFIAKMHAAGKKVGLYHSLSGYPDCGQDFTFVADWATTAPSVPWTIWQVGGTGIDKDNFHGTHADMANWIAGLNGGTNLNSYAVPTVPSVGDVAVGKVLYTTDALVATDPARIIIDPARSMPFLGTPSTGVSIVEYVNSSGVPSGKAYFMHSADLTNVRPVVVPAAADTTTPFSQADVDTKVAAAVAPLNASITGLQAQVTTLTGTVTQQSSTIDTQAATIATLKTQLTGANISIGVEQAKVADLQTRLDAEAPQVAQATAFVGWFATLRKFLGLS